MNLVLAIGLLLLIGLTGGRLIGWVKLPAVTGYILIGVVFGQSLLGLFTPEVLSQLSPVSDLALSLIAFTIGSKIEFTRLSQYRHSLGAIILLESFGAFILVTMLMYLLGESFSVALLLGATAIATAPAGTLSIINEYRASGPLTDSLLTIVALDDIIALLVFGFVLAFVKAFNGDLTAFPLFISIAEIIVSIGVGALMGLLIAYIAAHTGGSHELLVVVLGIVLFTTGGMILIRDATVLNLSYLLANTAAGAMISNYSGRRIQIFEAVHQVETPIYVAFFTLAGASLRLDLIPLIGIVGLGYVVARAIGKYTGAYLGGKISGLPPRVSRNLGLGLLSQAGLAIGLALVALEQLPVEGEAMLAVILAAVATNEIIGPITSRLAITRSGEAHTR